MKVDTAGSRCTLLITGTTGFLGQQLIRQLDENAQQVVRRVERKIDKPSPTQYKDMVYIDDISTTTNWSDALKNCDVVIHMAARVHVMEENATDPLAEFRQVNVDGTINLATQAAQSGVKRFIFISSIKVNGEETQLGRPYRPDDPPNPQESYAISKMEAEQQLQALAEKTGMEVVIIRPTIIYGPGVKGNFERMMAWLEKGYPLPLRSIKNKRSLVSIYNLVDLIIRCIDHPKAANQIFLVSDAEDVSIGELLRKTASAMNKSVRLIPVPHWVLSCAGKLTNREIVVQRLCGSLQVDISKTCELLDWKPIMTMDEALLRTTAKI